VVTQLFKKKKNTNNSIRKWTEDMNRHFSKENIQMTKKHRKMFDIGNNSLIIKKYKSKPQMRQFTPISMAI
jgi:hypothetical protein